MGGVLGSSRASLVLLSALMLSWEQWVTVIAIEGFKTLKKIILRFAFWRK